MISREEFRQIAANGIWQQNTSLVQILGLCPLLAVTTNLVNGVMLSLATIIVMAIANVAVAALRNLIPHEIRIPVFILIVAALVTVVDLLFNAQLHELYLVLGIFIPLIVTNCIVLARVEAFANKNPPLQSLHSTASSWGRHVVDAGPARRSARTDRRRHAAGRDRHGLSGLQPLQLLPADYPGFLLALLPPGAFILLGCLIAWKNWVEARAAARQPGRAGARAGRLRPMASERRRRWMYSAPGTLRPPALCQPGTDHRTRLRQHLPVADCRHPVGTGHRQERQSRHPAALCRRADAAGDTGTRRKRSDSLHQPHRPLPGQDQEHSRHLPAVARTTRRRSPALARSPRGTAGGRSQDRQRGPQHRFRRATIAVDTHIFRVANRTGLAPGKTPLAVERELLQAVPEEFLHAAHHWLILHGRYVCKARKPDCWRCSIADLCAYPAAAPTNSSDWVARLRWPA
jgi:electron transport complex protein RnfE